MQSLRVTITDEIAAKLLTLAEREYRAPRQQAAALLAAAIERETDRSARRRRGHETIR